MTQIPPRRNSPQELPASARARARSPLPPHPALARQTGGTSPHLSVGDWLITLILLAVPILNIVLIIYWAFFSSGNQGRINFCRATLLLTLAGIIIVLLFSAAGELAH
ncbi:hypothetical protein [Luteolibacter sp. AS25]|uniref:hypothetical protein n=1 Tax=Luteolibacter sp. AS25 TaxID=3135776 RepID=UPI00398B7613